MAVRTDIVATEPVCGAGVAEVCVAGCVGSVAGLAEACEVGVRHSRAERLVNEVGHLIGASTIERNDNGGIGEMNFSIELLNDIPYEHLILGCGSDDERVGARLGNNRAKRGLRRSKAQRLLETLLEVCITAGLTASSLGRIGSEHVLHEVFCVIWPKPPRGVRRERSGEVPVERRHLCLWPITALGGPTPFRRRRNAGCRKSAQSGAPRECFPGAGIGL